MLALLTTLSAYAQETIDNTTTATVEEGQVVNTIYMSSDELFDTFKDCDQADDIEVNSFMLGLAKMAAPREERAFLNKIKSMRIIDLTPCSEADRERFVKLISTIELTSFEPAVDECNDENENDRVRIYIKIKGDNVTEMIIASWDEKECQLLQFKGKLSISDIEAAANGAGSSVI
jgi:hypothetical protein